MYPVKSGGNIMAKYLIESPHSERRVYSGAG